MFGVGPIQRLLAGFLSIADQEAISKLGGYCQISLPKKLAVVNSWLLRYINNIPRTPIQI